MIEQGSAEWKALRLGKATASRVADVVCKTSKGWGAGRANYAAALVAERLTGVPQETYMNGNMQWGKDHEAPARDAYEYKTDQDVALIDFVDHPRIPMSGCSPDGYVATDGLIEIKCPGTAVHIATLLGEPIDGKYIKQMQWQMACTGRKFCDFVSFDPRMPPEMQLHIERVARDQKCIDELEAAVIDFLAEVTVTVERLRAKYQPTAEAA